ncbi:MAG: protein kinase, partial [Kiritimatiellae bacterium]|nr:protein kinase [Kiritimatiellia bacterium]
GWGILEEWGGKRWKPGEEILGRYVVEKELGQGGMGVVYACLDKVGGVRVAVKALPPELSHNSVEMEEVRANFELVYKLSHPNIAGVRTLERDGKGEYFLVMEIAEGVSLRRWMRRKLRSEESGVRSQE